MISAVRDQVRRGCRSQQPALTAGQTGIQALAVALDGERPADLDSHGVRGRQGHANIMAIRWA
jgi:hypothetical protein